MPYLRDVWQVCLNLGCLLDATYDAISIWQSQIHHLNTPWSSTWPSKIQDFKEALYTTNPKGMYRTRSLALCMVMEKTSTMVWQWLVNAGELSDISDAKWHDITAPIQIQTCKAKHPKCGFLLLYMYQACRLAALDSWFPLKFWVAVSRSKGLV